jgi:hypothetical protein
MTRGEVYFLHDGDVIGLPPDYRPIVLRIVAVVDGRSGGSAGHDQQQQIELEEKMKPVGVMEVKESQQYADDLFADDGRRVEANTGTRTRRWNRADCTAELDHPSDATTPATTAANCLGTRTMQEDVASQEERAQSEGGRLLGMLPDYRPLRMWWLTGGEQPGQQSEAAMTETETEGEATVRPDAAAAPGGWIRRKRKSDDVKTAGRSSSHGDAEARAHDAGDEPIHDAGEDERLAKKMRRASTDRCSPPEDVEERTEAPAGAEDSVLLLKAMFGDVEERELCKVLVENGGDVNQAIDSLLNLVAIRNGEAGSLPLADEGAPAAAEDGRATETRTTTTRTTTSRDGDDDAVGLEDEGDMEWSEGDERIVDSMKGTRTLA